MKAHYAAEDAPIPSENLPYRPTLEYVLFRISKSYHILSKQKGGGLYLEFSARRLYFALSK